MHFLHTLRVKQLVNAMFKKALLAYHYRMMAEEMQEDFCALLATFLFQFLKTASFFFFFKTTFIKQAPKPCWICS